MIENDNRLHTTTEITTTNTTAVGLLTEGREAAWGAIRAGMRLEGTNEHSDHYTDAVHSACQHLREAGEALEAAVEAVADKLGVDMDDVLSLCVDRGTAPAQ